MKSGCLILEFVAGYITVNICAASKSHVFPQLMTKNLDHVIVLKMAYITLMNQLDKNIVLHCYICLYVKVDMETCFVLFSDSQLQVSNDK